MRKKTILSLGLILGLTTGCYNDSKVELEKAEQPGFRIIKHTDKSFETYEQWIVDWNKAHTPEIIEREMREQQRNPEYLAWENSYNKRIEMEKIVNNNRKNGGSNELLWLVTGYIIGKHF